MYKKKDYEIIFNDEVLHPKKQYCYSYGKTENIQLLIDKKSICIKFSIGGQEKTANDFIVGKNYLFADALRKALLVFSLVNNTSFIFHKILIKIDKKVELQENRKDYFPFFSLLNAKKLNIPDAMKTDKVISRLLKYTKSCSFSRISAVYAYIFSKSKENETEKFMYQWMAFNGIYNYMSSCANSNKIQGEKQKLQLLLRVYNIGEKILNRDVAKNVYNLVSSEIKKLEVSNSYLEMKDSAEYANFISSVGKILSENKLENTSVYGYLLADYAYRCRCFLFHSEKPLLLFSFKDELKELKFINSLLENFLDQELPKWCDDDFVNQMSEKIRISADAV